MTQRDGEISNGSPANSEALSSGADELHREGYTQIGELLHVQPASFNIRKRAKFDAAHGQPVELGQESDVSGDEVLDVTLRNGHNQVHLFGAFDGVGSHSGDNLASTEAATAAAEYVNRWLDVFNANVESEGIEYAADVLKEALESANMKLSDSHEQGLHQADTTATLGLIFEHDSQSYLAYASVGDSAIKKVRGGQVVFSTEEERVDEDGRRHVITNSLGGDQLRINDSNIGVVSLEYGDTIVAATDGLLGDEPAQRIIDQDFAAAVTAVDAEQAMKNLFMESLRVSDPKTDDTSCVVVNVKHAPIGSGGRGYHQRIKSTRLPAPIPGTEVDLPHPTTGQDVNARASAHEHDLSQASGNKADRRSNKQAAIGAVGLLLVGVLGAGVAVSQYSDSIRAVFGLDAELEHEDPATETSSGGLAITDIVKRLAEARADENSVTRRGFEVEEPLGVPPTEESTEDIEDADDSTGDEQLSVGGSDSDTPPSSPSSTNGGGSITEQPTPIDDEGDRSIEGDPANEQSGEKLVGNAGGSSEESDTVANEGTDQDRRGLPDDGTGSNEDEGSRPIEGQATDEQQGEVRIGEA